jgi:predicted nucleic acid-binding protein
MIYIFDASFVGALIIPDEKNPQVSKMYAKIQNEDVKFTPHLLWYEIANIFNKLIRDNRYEYNKVQEFIPLLAALHLETDSVTGTNYSQKLLHLCNKYKLSAYDAAYLELAERKKAILCTLDKHLRMASQKHGVAVIK